MNRERVEYCIELMENVDRNNFCMINFQYKGPLDKVARNITDLHTCGNSACFAGYVALSERFQREGGKVANNPIGAPIFKYGIGSRAIALYLGITEDTADALVSGAYDDEDAKDDFYPVEFSEVKPEHVIEKLKLILSGELL